MFKNIFGNSTTITKDTNSHLPVLPTANISMNISPPSVLSAIVDNDTRLIAGGKTTQGAAQLDSSASLNHWCLADFWMTTSGGQLPNYMDGTLKAVTNNPYPLSDSDYLGYIPINIGYGDPFSGDWLWFQFAVIFRGQENPFFMLQVTPSWLCDSEFQDEWIFDFPADHGVGYAMDHVYDFAIYPSDQYTITFTITDRNTTNSYSRSSWYPYSIMSTQIVAITALTVSPCSAVEGFTANTSFDNIPFLPIYMGEGLTTYFHSELTQWPWVTPDGIDTGVWTGDSYGHFYWAVVNTNNYVATINESYPIGSGCVVQPERLIGLPNNYFAYIGGANNGDGGYIWAQMASSVSGGNIYVRAYSNQGYYSDLYVYVSDDLSNWIQLGDYITVSFTPVIQTYYFGSYLNSFRYIAIVGLDTCNTVSVYLDSVFVGVGTDDVDTGYVANIVDHGTYGTSSTVAYWNSLTGVNPDGNYAYIIGANNGDGGYITGKMEAEVCGTIWISGYSVAGYYSNLYVYVSNDNQHWNQVGTCLTITQSSPYWISPGSYTQGFRYITVVGLDTDWSVNLRLDCIRVQ